MVRTLFCSLGALASSGLLAQLGEEKFISPPREIADLVTAPWWSNLNPSNFGPGRPRALVAISDGQPTIALLARRFYNLGGVVVDPMAYRERSINVRRTGAYEIWDLGSGAKVRIGVPNASLGSAEWSPDGSQIAFLAHFDDGSRVWVADATTGKARQVSARRALTTLSSRLQWTDTGRAIAAILVPESGTAAPEPPPIPEQPIVRLTDPRRNSLRTYRSLLETASDQVLFEHYTTGQLAVVDLGGKVRSVGAPAMIRQFSAAPDGSAFRVTTTLKPFSYIVPASQFGQKEELWGLDGKVIAELSKRELTFDDPTPPDPPAPGPITPGQPRGGRGGAPCRSLPKRLLSWRPDGKGLSYLQMEPMPPRPEGAEGEQPQPVAQPPRRKDRVMQWLPPYGPNDAKVVYESDSTIASVRYSPDCQTLFITETRAPTETMFAVKLSEPTKKYTIYSRSIANLGDTATRVGTLVNVAGPAGIDAVRISAGGLIFMSGVQTPQDPTQEAPRPYLESIEIATGKKERLWQSSADFYEQFQAILDDEGQRIMIRRESATVVPDTYVLDLVNKGETKITANQNFAPKVTEATRERFQVTRPDGFKFWVEVILPKWAFKGMRLPAIFWFYPAEFANQRAYDDRQRNYNKNDFPNLGPMSIDYMVTRGYAVVKPDCPIVGPTPTTNDLYVNDLRNNLSATIDELDRRGYIDRQRLAIGGHSYGAFSTLNAMVHTPFFKVGIAGDGNYNRTLTPFAFQNESRRFWEARFTYQEMSPLFYAERLTGAVLLYHGMDDQNIGTDPVNSVNMFLALEALGKTAALYMYPYEGHSPVARESLLDLWARWVEWLDKYLQAPK